MIKGLTGNFNQDEKILLDYTIQEIEHKKKQKKIQLISLAFVILIFVTLGIFTFSVVMKDNDLRSEYGDYYHCYMCGYVNGKTCLCNSLPNMAIKPDKSYFEELGQKNTMSCEKPLD